MKKRLFPTTIILFMMIMAMITLVEALPLEEKNNDKFQAISTTGTFSVFDLVSANHEYVPSFDQVNKLTTTYDEHYLTYTITVGSAIYRLGVDFTHTGYSKITHFDPVFADSAKLRIVDFRAEEVIVDYMFDFSAFSGGIEGTLNMRAVFFEGNSGITSLSGTGDLQNVQIKETALAENVAQGIVTVNHAGLVQSWPDIPPAS